MSRVGKKPILLPKNVQADEVAGSLRIKGPLGEWVTPLPESITVHIIQDQNGAKIEVAANPGNRTASKIQGLYRALIANAAKGVTELFKHNLEIHGIGYECELKDNTIGLKLGTANFVRKAIPRDVKVKVTQNTTQGNKVHHIEITGISKQAVGQFSSSLRLLRIPDPYKQKGIRYEGETLRKKAGKSFAGGK